MLSLHIENASGETAVPDDEDIHRWASAALGNDIATELSIRLVNTEESAQLNERFRGRSKPTNVLSFPADLPADAPCSLIGDIAICAPVIAIEAREQNKQLDAHWAHMIIHGCLHLLGYDHIESVQAEQMEQLEITLLEKLGFSNPYQSDYLDTNGQQQ